MTVVGVEMAFQAPDTAPAGVYTVTFRNDGSVVHELAFKDANGNVVARTSTGPHTTTAVEVKLSKGTYELTCREPGHQQAGMHKTLTVS